MWVRIYNPVQYLGATCERGGKAFSVVFFPKHLGPGIEDEREEEEGRSVTAESKE